MNVLFAGQPVRSVGHAAKTRLRDYLRTALQSAGWNGTSFQCDLVDDLEVEAPNGKPLLSIHTGRRSVKLRTATERRVSFVVEVHVLADATSGVPTTASNGIASDELLSDDVENVLTSEEARTALAALGLEGVMVGERRESVSPTMLHRNVTPVTFEVDVTTPNAA